MLHYPERLSTSCGDCFYARTCMQVFSQRCTHRLLCKQLQMCGNNSSAAFEPSAQGRRRKRMANHSPHSSTAWREKAVGWKKFHHPLVRHVRVSAQITGFTSLTHRKRKRKLNGGGSNISNRLLLR